MTRTRKPILRNLAQWFVIPALLASALTAGMSVLTVQPATAATDPCAAPVASAVACENTLPGTPRSDWDVSGTGDTSIQGFATSMSVAAGSPVRFKIKTPASSYRIDILRLGYYQGNGARKVAAGLLPSASLPQSQPACLTFSATGLVDCGNWAQSATWNVPAAAVSGVYIAHLIRNDNGGSSLIPFVVRNDASTSSIVFQTSDTTWQAYNNYGGNSLYRCTVACPPGEPQGYKAAYAVSYNRPFNPDAQGPNWLMDAEMPMIRFMEANGYDVTYQAGVDTSTRGSLLLNHKVFMSTGHDEYWDASQRANVEAARNAGVNLAFFSGNEIFWKTRWTASSDGSSTPGRTIVCYKDTHFNAPTDPVAWTGTWRDPRYGTSGGGGNPENALTGQFFLVNAGSTDIKVPAEYASMRLWRNTAAAALTGTQSLTLGSGLDTLGYEWDVDSDNGFRPAGAFRLSSTTLAAPEVFTDYGTSVAPATVTHNLTMYRAPSGALVFGAGTVQWSYGLDSYPDRGAPDRNMQQATVNLFADMGAQPATLMTGLVAATKSTDTTAPASVITSGLGGQTIADGTKITITGTAADTGGVVAGVEVSTDAGATWRPATGKGSWTFSWIAHGSPTANVKTRAVDDSGNLETPAAGATVTITCPCSIFGPNVIPDVADSGDTGSVELGLRFTSDTPGTVTGVRFYKSTNNKGTHSGSLWSSTGQRLATANFTGETASGWQSVTFSTPVAIAANTSYVVSYFAPQGHYAQASGYLYPHPSPMPAGNASVDSAPLHATRSTPAQGNGLYNYSGTSSFPTNTFGAENYWVDVIYSAGTSTAPVVTSTTPANGATGMPVSTMPTATFDQPVTPSSITFTLRNAAGTAVAGTTAYNATNNRVTFTPAAALAYSTVYTATVSGATTSAGKTMTAPATWSFTTAATPTVPTVTSTSPAAGATGVAVSATPTATFDQPVTPSSITFTLKDAGNNSVGGATSYDTGSDTVRFTPTVPLANSTSYTASVSGATNVTGQTMTTPRTWTFTTAAAGACPCSVFSPSAVPATVTENDSAAVELGMKFRSDVAGTVTGIRFYKGSQNIGTHTGHLWTSTGTLLATVTFAGETASGWQQASLAAPVAISAGTTYVVSYFAPNGYYSANGNYFAGAADNAPLHGLASGTDGPNGVYNYGTATFPTSSYNASNYWVDVVFLKATTAPVVTATTPVAGATGVALDTAPSATFDQAVTPASIAFTLKDAAGVSVAGTTSYSSITNTATFTPTAALAYATSYTATVSGAANTTGQAMAAPKSWTFTTAAAPSAPTVTSTTPAAGATGVAAGTAPSATFDQAVTGSSITFTLKDAAGVAVAGTTGYTGATNTVTFTPAAALAYSTGYTATVSGATNSTGQSMTTPKTWTFTTAAAPAAPTVTSTTPAAGAIGVAVGAAPSATFDQAVTASSITFTLKDAAGVAVSGSSGYSGTTNTVTFTPASALANSTSYTATVSGAENATGQAMTAPRTWSFTTAAVGECPCSVFSPSDVPATLSDNDSAAVELGMKFRSSVAATVTGIRFYKGAENTGTHTGHLWTSAGTLLASVTFTGETASGWQQANLSTPVNISANTTYVVSYHAPNGRYSATSNFFTTAANSPPLQGLASGTDGPNGIYIYGAPAFPDSSFRDANYWVDVVVTTAPPAAPVVTATAPAAGATGVAVSTAPWATFDQAVTPASIGFTLKTAAGTSVTGTTAYDAATDRVTFTPAAALANNTTYTATVSGATNSSGQAMEAPRTWSFTTTATGACPCSVFSASAVPATITENDPRAVELGMKFRSSVAGSVTGIRFYKGSQNTGTHTGHLWSSTGTLLATVTFTGETASGWQQATLSAPVSISANTTYVVSYFAPAGRYSASANFFNTAANSPPLQGLASGTDGPNGIYRYGTTSGFPTSSYRGTNYWVDVVFTTAP